MAQAPHHGSVAIGDEVHRRVFGREILVLHDHEQVARGELFLAVEHLIAYALVVDVGAFVRPRDHHGLVDAHLRVARSKLVDKLGTAHKVYVGIACQPQWLPQAYAVGVPEYSRAFGLAQHLVHIGLEHPQPIAFEHHARQRRSLALPHRGQLCGIADKQQAAVLPAIDKRDEVVEQGRGAVVAHHRSLVDDEERVACVVEVQAEAALHALLAVDAAVDGEGLGLRCHAAAQCQHLGGSPRGSHEHHFLVDCKHRAHHGSRQRGLASAGRATHYHHHLLVAAAQKAAQHAECALL